jgi:hypothetical protein
MIIELNLGDSSLSSLIDKASWISLLDEASIDKLTLYLVYHDGFLNYNSDEDLPKPLFFSVQPLRLLIGVLQGFHWIQYKSPLHFTL